MGGGIVTAHAAPLTPDREQEIREAVATFGEHPVLGFACCSAHDAADAAPVLLAEIGRLRARLAALESAGDRTAFRTRIADALADADEWQWAPGFDKTRSPSYQGYLRQADAVLTVLPERTPF